MDLQPRLAEHNYDFPHIFGFTAFAVFEAFP